MTYGEVIKQCDEFVPNDISEAQKIELLFEFELNIMQSVMLLSQAEIDSVPKPSSDTELIVRRPHTKLYRLWLCSVLHKANGDYQDAANMVSDYEAAYYAFAQMYGRTTAPGRGQAEYKGYYLSAYALAVLNGYKGDVIEWLASLKGAKGDDGSAYVISEADYAEIAAYCAEHYDEKVAEMTAVLEKAKNVSVTAVGGESASVSVEESDESVTLTFTVPKGADGSSVTVALVEESSEDDGNNIVTFSDGKVLNVKNGKTGSPGYTPQKGVDYFADADLYYPSYDGSNAQFKPALGGILYFESAEDFEEWKDNGWEYSDGLYGGRYNVLIVIAGVPTYMWVGANSEYIPFASPMLESEKDELKAYIDETFLGGEW